MDDNQKKEVGNRIRTIRKSRGESQTEFAQKINATLPAVSNWETGRNIPNNERLKAIADIGGITVQELLIGKKYDTAKMSLKDYLHYELDKYIQEAFPQNSKIDKVLSTSKVTSSDSDYSKENRKNAKTIKELGKKYIDDNYYSDITLETLQAVNSKLTIDNFIQYRENAWYEFKSILDKEVAQLRFSTERDVLYLIKKLFINEFEVKFINALEQFDTSDELNQFITTKIEPILTEAAQKIISASDDVIN